MGTNVEVPAFNATSIPGGLSLSTLQRIDERMKNSYNLRKESFVKFWKEPYGDVGSNLWRKSKEI